MVWPLFGEEDDETRIPQGDANGARTPIEIIVSLLQAAGIGKIVQHDDRYAMEFCDDCGAPLYPDLEGDLTHAEMPEDLPQAPSHLH